MSFLRRKKIVYMCLAAGLILCGFSIVQADFNEQINFQGKLTNSSNVAVPDDAYNFEFSLYATDTAGVALWTELCTTTEQITVSSGLFSHLLGSVTALDDSIFNQTLWLEVKVGGTSTSPSWETLTPRKKLGAVSAAFEAKRLGGKLESAFGTLSENETITGLWNFTTSSASSVLTVTQSGAGYGAIITGGNVGIGTSNPEAKLDVEVSSGGAVTIGNSGTSATGSHAVAIGATSTASGDYSTAIGFGSTATGTGSIALGYGAVAGGIGSSALGALVNANGSLSTALGYGTLAMGQGSMALGVETVASGTYSTVLGNAMTVNGAYSLGIGLSSDRATITEDNVMAIMGGNVGIGTASPAHALDVNGSARLGSSTDSSLYFRGLSNFNSNFYIDASGNVATGTWQGTTIGATYGGTGTSTTDWTGFPYITAGVWGTTTVSGGIDTNWIINGNTMYATDTVTFVGIGTTTPASTFSVYGTSTFTGNMLINGYSIDSSGVKSAGWEERYLYDSDGDDSIDWEARYLYDYVGTEAIDWANRSLFDSSGYPAIEWKNNIIIGSSTESIISFNGLSNFNDNFYIDSSGNVATGTWQGTAIGTTYGGTGTSTSDWTGFPYITAGVWGTSTVVTTESDPIWTASSSEYARYGDASTTNWDTVYSTVNASSSNWDLAYGEVNASSSFWDLGYLYGSTFNSSSTNYDTAYAWAYDFNASSTNYNTAYSQRLQWDGGSTNLVAATGRTSLGLGAMALESNVGSTTIHTVGTIATGTWNGTTIAYNYGGTGTTTALASQYLWWGDGTGNLVQIASSTLAGSASISGGQENYLPVWNSGTTLGTSTIYQSGTNIGIGTTSPTKTLSVVGTIYNYINSNSQISQVATTSVDTPKGIKISGHYAYVTGNGIISVVDIYNPLIPKVVGTTTVDGSPIGLYISGKYAYTANYTNPGSISIIDISNPSAPLQVATTSVSVVGGNGPSAIHVSGKYAYTANYTATVISIIDISNPLAPTEVATASVGAYPLGIYVSGKYAYVTNGMSDTLSIVDISNPLKPFHVASTSVGDQPQGVYVSGRYAYVSNYGTNDNLAVVDISNPYAPVKVASTTALGSNPYDVVVSGKYAYIANNGSDYISIIDVSSTSTITQVATTSVGDQPQSIAVSGRYAYVTNYNDNTISVIDLGGIDTNNLYAGSLETGNVQVENDVSAQGTINVGTALNVGSGGISSQGGLGVSGTSVLMGNVGIGTNSTLNPLTFSGSGYPQIGLDTVDGSDDGILTINSYGGNETDINRGAFSFLAGQESQGYMGYTAMFSSSASGSALIAGNAQETSWGLPGVSLYAANGGITLAAGSNNGVLITDSDFTKTTSYKLDVEGPGRFVNSGATTTLTVQQIGTGNIVDFADSSASVFTLKSADQLKLRSGLVQTWGNFNDKIVDDFEDNSVSNWTSSDTTNTPVTATSTYVRVNDYAMAIRTTVSTSSDDTATTSVSSEDWSGYEKLSFWIRAGYTTTSTDATTTQIISVLLHDTSGTTSSSTISISEENEWQYQEWDLSVLGSTDKDAVDWIGFRIDNDYGSPLFYIDQIRLYDADLQTGEMFVDNKGNLVIWGQETVEIGRTAANGSLPGIKVDSAVVELNQPLSVNVGGDVGFDYDLVFNNTGLSTISSEGPLAILAGDINHYENLTLGTGGTGDVIIDISNSTLGLKVLGSSTIPYVFTIAPSGTVTIAGNMLPASTTYYTLGDSTYKWGNIYTATATIDNSVGIATTTPSANLQVYGNVKINLPGAGTGYALCHTSQTGTTTQEIVDCTSAPAADYAEIYPVHDDVELGDIVVSSFDTVTTTQNNVVAKLAKTSVSYQENIIGIVSDPSTASDFNVIGYNIKEEDKSLPIALNGRVVVKISDQNGLIEIGDQLTSSDIPGTAMKATDPGMVIGTALEGYNATGTGKIMIFVNPHWSIGSLIEDGTLGDASSTSSSTESAAATVRVNVFVEKIKEALASIGMIFEDGIAKIKSIVTEKITAKRVSLEKMEMTDQITGELYCTWIENGEWVKVLGDCETAVYIPSEESSGTESIPSNSGGSDSTEGESDSTTTEEVVSEDNSTSTEDVATTTDDIVIGDETASSTESTSTTEEVCQPIEEICDGIDNDCDELIDEDCDCGETFCQAGLNLTGSCQNSCEGELGCVTCAPQCGCIAGFFDCNGDGSGQDQDGCEATEACIIPTDLPVEQN